ncbi:hypothetical protein HQN86_17970 [Pedobacter panaciterrae]|nr:hypothetical protein [Pedobacter panaciterrae]
MVTQYNFIRIICRKCFAECF